MKALAAIIEEAAGWIVVLLLLGSALTAVATFAFLWGTYVIQPLWLWLGLI